MNIKSFIKIMIVCSFFIISCSDEKKNKSKYKKNSDIPLTGQSINKKHSPSKKVSDFY